MKYSHLANRIAVTIAAGLLAACGGSQPPIGTPSAMPRSRTITTYDGNDQSLTVPDAHGRDLLYVTGSSNY